MSCHSETNFLDVFSLNEGTKTSHRNVKSTECAQPWIRDLIWEFLLAESFQHPPRVQPTSPASPANQVPLMMAKVRIQVRVQCNPCNSGGVGGGGSPRMMIAKVMIQLNKQWGGWGGWGAFEKVMIQLEVHSNLCPKSKK